MNNLSAAEKLQGWVEFVCPDHGFLVATTPRALVVCSCGKRAYEHRAGRKLDRWERRRLTASLSN
jgi:hypothetical protein